MMLVTQIHIGTNMVLDGVALLDDAANREGFAQEGSITSEHLAMKIEELKALTAKLTGTLAKLRENDRPRPRLVAAE